MDNLFEEIRSIEIGSSSYAESLNDMIRIINENFNRISGAPFLKGDRGNSFHTYELKDTRTTFELTTLKEAIYDKLQEVYNEDPRTDELQLGVARSCTSITDLSQLKYIPVLLSFTIQQYCFIPSSSYRVGMILCILILQLPLVYTPVIAHDLSMKFLSA